MPIKILPETTINKIAAGEVVERPANAVKELLENSLDAKSTSIEVEIRDAGRRLLRVRDNGAGIAPGEIKLAVTRHATSKISDFDDLEKLYSMGFRGEALPSIAAVSNLTIQSQIQGSASGWEMKLSGGKLNKEGSWAGAPGTNIEVSDLFFNTPARAKFLKSDQTERGRIIKIIEELALAWPEVSFKAVLEGKTVLETPKANDPLERVTDVLGADFASTVMRVEVEHPFLKISAFVTHRENSLSSKNFQFLFINRRPVNFSRSILHAVYEAYRENLPAGRHPGAVIFLEINPSEIDVNIHPTKREVRFSKEAQIHHLLYTSIREALRGAPASKLMLNDGGSYAGSGPVTGRKAAERHARFSYSDVLARSGLFTPPAANGTSQSALKFAESAEAARRIIGQLFNTYIIAQDGDELVVLDQHAAAERIRYEKYLEQWRTGKITLQPLLFPENIELPASLFAAAAAGLPLLKEAGWDVAEFGSNTLRIASVPAVLGAGASVSGMLKEILEALAEEKKIPNAEKIEKIIRAACRSSIKAGDTVSGAESSKLLEELLRCASPNTCPHGRPTMLRISKQEMGKHFSRG